MLSRRVLLATTGGLGLAVAGCAVTPLSGPSTNSSPTASTAAPDPVRDAFVAAHASLAAAYEASVDPGHEALFAWALGVMSEQGDVVGTSLPAVPLRTAVTPSPGAPAASPTPGNLTSLADALKTMTSSHQMRALSPETAQPLVWASTAAWASALGSGLDRTSAPCEDRRDRIAPPSQSVAEAGQDALTASEQALFAVQVAGGAPGLTPTDLADVRSRIEFWQRLRDDVRATLNPSTTPAPTPAAPWFLVDSPTDTSSARALIVRVESASLPILGRSLAFGSDSLRARLADALTAISTELPKWGGPLLRWPGWPRS